MDLVEEESHGEAEYSRIFPLRNPQRSKRNERTDRIIGKLDTSTLVGEGKIGEGGEKRRRQRGGIPLG